MGYLMTDVKQPLYLSIKAKAYGRNSCVCVRINGTYTDWFDIRRGDKQGCATSPWLFNLFMDSCLYDLKEYECRLMRELSVKYLLYVDDQVILASSACGLQKWVGVAEEKRKIFFFHNRNNAMKMRSLYSMCGVSRKDKCRNCDDREGGCALMEDVVTKVEKGVLRWFGHLERMNESGLSKQIYRANVCDGKVGKGRPRKSYADHIGGKKG
ncbi:hypothetical protein EVAR_9566_1 [Eumeta japonica]|uniref:Reverse transcriptase domain-containing protein n=1 Tax=Eumeta variegata TaxID=151549 RepID=A0A4C1U3U5_EUMVA|nr:hypothetical protein EVAR_9566_1 [Eumeta japonica]